MDHTGSAYLSYFSIQIGNVTTRASSSDARSDAFSIRCGAKEVEISHNSPDALERTKSLLRQELEAVMSNDEELTRWIKWAIANPDLATADAQQLSGSTLVCILLRITPRPAYPEDYDVTALAVENGQNDWLEFKIDANSVEPLEDTLHLAGVLIKSALRDYAVSNRDTASAPAMPVRRLVH